MLITKNKKVADNKRVQNNPIHLFPTHSLFQFHNEDHIYVLVGYPHWRAFILTPKSNLRLEVFPRINVSTKKIEFLEEPTKENGKESVYIKIKDAETLNSYLEKEKEFFNTVPEEITNRVKVFSDSHWEIIKAITVYGDNFNSLINANPVLAYLLVNLDKINPSFSLYVDNCYLERLITEKQKEILELAGFPASKRMVKIFAKFDPTLVDVDLLKSFRQDLTNKPEHQEKIFKLLSHSKVVNKNLLHLIVFSSNILKHLSQPAIQELITSDSFLTLLKQVKKMAARANKWQIEFKVDKLSNLDRLEVNLNDAVKRKKDEINIFPLQPIPDGEGIYALTPVAQLNSWAKKQQNCIRSYAQAVFARKCYLYKVILAHEEATLEILRLPDGLKFGQIKGFRDSRVSKALLNHSKKWFNDYMIQSKKREHKYYKLLQMELGKVNSTRI